MPRSDVVPLTQLGSRVPEHGRIRMGEKHGKAMRALERFRFTSPDEQAIAMLAERYGGEVQPWFDVTANPANQFQVYSQASVIDVWLPEDAVSVWYELWSGGGLQRRCDGETMMTTDSRGDPKADACLCSINKRLACAITTRINVILPVVHFAGTWRLQSKGWGAAKELPAMEEFIHAMQERGMTRCQLAIVKREAMVQGKKKHYVVPQLRATATPEQMLSGGGRVLSISAGPTAETPVAIGVGEPDIAQALIEHGVIEDGEVDIIDAEIVEDGPPIRFKRRTHALAAGYASSEIIKDDSHPDEPWLIVRAPEASA